MGKESKESKKKSKRKKKHSKKHKHKEKKHKHSKKRKHDDTSSSESDSEYSSTDSASESSRSRDRSSKKRKVEKEDTAKRRKSDTVEKFGQTAQDESLVKLAALLKKQEEEEKAAKRKRMAPMSFNDYQQKESELRRVFDEDTGRWRLVRGSGEIVEEIVSKEQQKKINKMATFGDGYAYQKAMGLDPTYNL
eukprot:comp11958_c0_seq1/m.6642 comp11958_c0_seq1/g.6642  ORF comp11958_c0_seq1/g.6642 comp11958_c0_seq1/m.6642 type:complete len:192 (-) comp11958_c0_seq1:417-992(-)